MKKTALLYLFLLFSLVISAQNFTHEFGKYSNEDFELKSCPFEPDAEAVMIYDIGRTFFGSETGGYNIYFEHTFKIKILSKAGLRFAEFSIPLYEGENGIERLESISANSYNFENGTVRVTALNPKETYSQRINKHWVIKKFAIPDVKEGTVFDVRYLTNSPYIFNFNDWNFQLEIPVIYSEYTAVIIPNVEYVYYLQGVSKVDEFKTYPVKKVNMQHVLSVNNDEMAYLFVLKNIPSIKADDFMSSVDDYRIKINFQLAGYASSAGSVVKVMTSWEELIKELLSHSDFGRYIKSGRGKAEEILETMNLPSTPLEKAKYLRKWVTENFHYDGMNSYFVNSSVKSFLETKVGNSAEINLFYLALLRAAGFDANPVIISTRDNGKINSDYPFTDGFNYVMVTITVDGKIFLLDATEALYRFEEIPPRCLNEKGLIVNEDQVQWMTFSSKVNSEIRYKHDLTLDPSEGKLLLKCDASFEGYDAARYRSSFSENYDSLRSELIHLNSTADSIKPKNLNFIDIPLELSFMEDLPLESADGKIIIEPFAGQAINDNPFKKPVRTYPVDFNYKQTRSFETIIHIPEGYKVLTRPVDFIMNNANMRVIYTIDDQVPGILKVTALYELKKDIYPSESYKYLKDYFDIIVTKFNEKIILDPKGI